ncbi:hypothetical protein NQ317_006664 [Molorchus minor]|uniref:acid phosphatase n=1 Tax=Molorchus minor TaxID=1323400 RepID=A0ABQ9JWL1_9CUCU|nr:hypothetical protein NQ317_006664 [Molorchus minor]
MGGPGIVFLTIAFGAVAAGLSNSRLLNVIQVYRHGERSPTVFYPNDPYQNRSYWGVAAGQLLNSGKRQHFELGRFTRRRYRDFLPLRYTREDFSVQSTILDRTFMSAASQLSGLFPPRGDQIWNPFVLWQPIPIPSIDVAIMSASSSCTRYNTLYSDVLENDEFFVNLNEEFQEVYEYLSNYTGSTVDSLTYGYLIYDALYIEELQNYPLPEWTKAVYPEPLKKLGGPFFKSLTFTEELKKLYIGAFLNAVLEQFDSYLEDSTSVKKYVQYSAHDSNVASILNTLGAYDNIPPNFASTIYFELRERNGTNFINIYYKNYGDPERITVSGCNFDCELEDFRTLVSNYTITSDEWTELCDTEVADKKHVKHVERFIT